MYISNGVDVNPTWVNVIATSVDGTNWTSILKSNIESVNMVYVAHPGEYSRHEVQTNIKVRLSSGFTIIFDCQDVNNQSGWSDGTITGLQQAVSDINSWL